jgi:murein DD-endopeptidase MepM/ murein hydrolase activator NlpD
LDVGRLPAIEARAAERVEVQALGPGETLGGVLGRTLGPREQNRVLMAFREQASPRRMRVGTEVSLRYRKGEGLRGVDVALNPDETVRLTRSDYGWTSDVVRTPTWTDTVYAAGVIDDVLWNAVVRNPAMAELPVQDRALLIHKLDQIFQWQIDFSRQIQSGDVYRFAFERQVRPDGSMRAGHVLAAELTNVGTAYEAVWFDPNDDGDGTYYDLSGKSVRRAFLRKPLEFRRISSRFNPARFHPVLKKWRSHRGVDYAADTGTEIMATADGVVTHAGRLGGLGIAVVVEHPNGFKTRYGHMNAVAASVRSGTRVRQGQTIGYVGSTGLATGPHLHYELWRGDRPVDPLAIELPAGDPVPADDRERWDAESVVRWALLDRLPDVAEIRYASTDAGHLAGETDAEEQDGQE